MTPGHSTLGCSDPGGHSNLGLNDPPQGQVTPIIVKSTCELRML